MTRQRGFTLAEVMISVAILAMIGTLTYGTFARVLGRYARDEKALTLTDAVRRLSGLPAENLKLDRRGLLKTGYFAAIKKAGDIKTKMNIAVVDAGVDRAGSDALLAQCDRVVESTADFGAVESEIALFAAGSRAASGDWLFFTEGHTVLDPDALAALARHVEREPGCAIVCGRRRNHARTRLRGRGNRARGHSRPGCRRRPP